MELTYPGRVESRSPNWGRTWQAGVANEEMAQTTGDDDRRATTGKLKN